MGAGVELNLLVGNAGAGEKYFKAQCASGHSITGDLAGVATRTGGIESLQNSWVAGRRAGRPTDAARRTPRVTVVLGNGERVLAASCCEWMTSSSASAPTVAITEASRAVAGAARAVHRRAGSSGTASRAVDEAQQRRHARCHGLSGDAQMNKAIPASLAQFNSESQLGDAGHAWLYCARPP